MIKNISATIQGVTLHLLAKALGAPVNVVTSTVSIIRISVVTIGVSVITGFSISGPLSTSTPGSYFDSGGLKTGPLEGRVVVNSRKTISEESKSISNWSNFSKGCDFSLGRGSIFFS